MKHIKEEDLSLPNNTSIKTKNSGQKSFLLMKKHLCQQIMEIFIVGALTTPDMKMPTYIKKQEVDMLRAMFGVDNFFTLGEITPMHERFTSEQYIEILEEVFLPTVKSMLFPDPEKISFVHENSPIHTARRVRQWFTEDNNIIDLIPWPSKGFDLNPIENIWGAIIRDWTPENERTNKALEEHDTDHGKA